MKLDEQQVTEIAQLAYGKGEKPDLRGAHLEGANLDRADLRAADLRGALYDEYTRWSVDFDPAEAVGE